MNATPLRTVRLDEMTPEIFTAVLGQARSAGAVPSRLGFPDAAVTAFTFEPLGVGQIADSYRVDLTFEGGQSATLVAKSAAHDEAARQAGKALGLYRREVGFYRDLAAGLEVAAPVCLHVDMNEDEDFLLLLEDLAPAVPCDQLSGCDADVAESVMEQAARLHAPRWGDERLDELGWLNMSTSWNEMQGSMYPKLMSGFADRYAGVADPAALRVGQVLADNLDAWYGQQNRAWTVQHGDFRLDNLLIDREDLASPVKVVDWQTVLLAPGVIDVSYFLGTSLDIDERRRCEEDLVRRYHEGLLAGGVQEYSWTDCWTDYRRYAFAGYLMATSASMVAERTERGDQLFLTMLGRSAAQIQDLDSEAFLTNG